MHGEATGLPFLRPRGDEGLSLIEVIVAVTLFALVAAATGAMLLTGIGVSRDSRNRTAASLVASEQLEITRNKATSNFTQIAGATVLKTVNSTPFTITQTAAFIPKNAPSGSCSNTGQGGNTGVQPVLLVTETVTWPRMDRTTPVTVATTLTPPIGAYPAGTGGVDIRVLDRNNLPVSGVLLTISGATPSTMTTNTAGCGYAAYLTPGLYNVVVSRAGYVDNQESTTSTQQVGVSNGQTASLTFYYDLAATINVSFGGSTPAATGLPITVGNSGLAPTPSFSFGVGVSRLTPLYPYSTYGIWAGRCPESYPAAVDGGNNLLWSPSSVTSVSPLQGQSVSAAVPLYPLTVTVQQPVGGGGMAGVNAASVAASETAGAAKNPCTGPFNTYGLTPSQRVGSVDGLSVTGLPLGTFTIKAVAGSRSGTATVVVRPSGSSVIVTVA